MASAPPRGGAYTNVHESPTPMCLKLPRLNAFYPVSRVSTWQILVVDLAEIGLPLLDEPHHPAMKKYELDAG